MVYVLVLILAAIAVMGRASANRQAKHAVERSGWLLADFEKALAKDGISREVAAAVADVLASWSGDPPVFPLPHDDLGSVYGLAGDDYREQVVAMLCRLRLTEDHAARSWPPGRIKTVRELAIALEQVFASVADTSG